MLTGRERNVLKKSAKISSSSRIMRFVEQIISVWGEREKKNNPVMNQDCPQDEKTKLVNESFHRAQSRHDNGLHSHLSQFLPQPPQLWGAHCSVELSIQRENV